MANTKPLVILTRPRAQSAEFAEALRQVGFDGLILQAPVIQVVSKPSIFDQSDVTGAIFTSANAVRHSPVLDVPAWCVGDRTASEAQKAGWSTISANGNVEALLKLIKGQALQGPLVHFRGEHSRGKLAQRLSNLGIPIQDVVTYQQIAQKLTAKASAALTGEAPVIVPLFSPRSARIFADMGPFSAPIHLILMSGAVSKEVVDLDTRSRLIVSVPTAKAMLEGIQSLIDAA
ncbi:uroporphyrinogen-III synthase [Cognatishimia sp. WU-CL00825]|uniref:uroporphyrinogen-III synthase n=1 Tax=Cognatishimia sp. WU-CL00825 TaxID=3127658 RepID=UPI00336591F5